MSNSITISDDVFFKPPQHITISDDVFFLPPSAFNIRDDVYFVPFISHQIKILDDIWFVPSNYNPRGRIIPPQPPGCQGCGAPIDCPSDDPFIYNLTIDPTLPFVENCPVGLDCNSAFSVNFNCCGHILTAQRPPNATAAQLQAIIQSFLTQCAVYQAQCGIALPTPSPIQSVVMYSAAGTCTVKCPDGSPFTFTDNSNLYWALTPQQAQADANAAACKSAGIQKICISALPSTMTVGAAFSQQLTATGFLATGIFTNLWELSVFQGGIPDGLTFTSGTYVTSSGPTLSGTPTTAGSYTFGVTVTNPNGVTGQRVYTVNVSAATANITPNVLSGATVYFNSGGSYAAGRYRIAYVNGAIQYGAGQGWALNHSPAYGYHVVFNSGDVYFPATLTEFATPALLESANAGAYTDITHNGGPIGIYLYDAPGMYGDNVGNPSPTFSLTPL
jgi:hypothetical protein